ncbi:MAG: hypothetical protein C5B51_24570 [Terriglobia bacterium]|nr:MAG: hypothetical protein C5B51_24570 [Terriglobia bacterium]
MPYRRWMTFMAFGANRTSAAGRINCRISPAIKRQAEKAAEIMGQSITAFTETALAEKADQVFARLSAIRLSEQDFARFVRAINRNPQPTAKLRKAAAEYKKLREKEPSSNW